MKRIFIIVTSIFLCITTNAQEKESNPMLCKSNFNLGIDLQTKYIWRGLEIMTEESAPVIFPQIGYQYKGVTAYVIGGYAINGKYAEVDLGLSYTYKWLTVGINDYYYPTTNSPKDNYFDFKGRSTGHWIEGVITIAPEKLPVYLTLSNFFAGTDKNLNGKQAFSTYAEIGGRYDFIDDNSIGVIIGAALNKSCYNDYTHSFGICNIETKYTHNIRFKNERTLPLSVSYIINPIYKKSHVNLTATCYF